ncbi:MAG: biotin transporter BioY [Dehalococcoidia bacterium]|nr:biotin transporter BioY [Dehalococcoidia bacterium]
MLAGSLVIALSAQVSIGLPVGPVPLTGQTLGVLLVGAALGSRLGMAAVAVYLAEGIAGLPVFANGAAGWAYFTGPTGGYLLGFVPAAFVVGRLAERGWDRDVPRTVAAMLLGNVVIYVVGAAHLQSFVGWSSTWSSGVEPFLIGDVVKVLVAAGALPGAWWLRRRLLDER